MANPTISSVLIDFVFDLKSSLVRASTGVSSSSPRLGTTWPPSPLSPIHTAAGSSGYETRHRRLPTCYSRAIAYWIEIDSVAVGRRPVRSVPLRSDHDGNKSLYLVFVGVVFFSASWTAFRAVRTTSWTAFRAVRTTASWLFC
jgi:hypothetical protein